MKLSETTAGRRLCSFFEGRQFPFLLLVIGIFVSYTGTELYGIYLYAAAFTAIMILMPDPSPTIYLYLPAAVFVANSHETAGQYVYDIPAVILMVAAGIWHLIHYKKRFVPGPCFWPMLGTCLALMLGGLGTISLSDYLRPGSLMYIFLIGPGMLLCYVLTKAFWRGVPAKLLRSRFESGLLLSGILSMCITIGYYLLHIPEFLASPSQIAVLYLAPYRGTVSLYLCMCLPFVFRRALHRPLYTLLAWGMTLTVFATTSRMGMGLAVLMMLAGYLYLIIKSPRFRLGNAAALFLAVTIGFVAIQLYLPTINDRGVGTLSLYDLLFSDSRTGLFRRALLDFLDAPLFGQGIGYAGNEDIYAPPTMFMHWYHNLLCQIFGSMGLFGAGIYLWNGIVHVRLLHRECRTNNSGFGPACAMSYAALLLASMLEPGLFAPIPCPIVQLFLFLLLEPDMADTAGELPVLQKRRRT